ncbi:lytic murein transglycosylase [Patescibacteria group bacterium AH-259-L05]|nr:lytic murein transglycosylase [Patescibacteria group bacterium AH-259-L05]
MKKTKVLLIVIPLIFIIGAVVRFATPRDEPAVVEASISMISQTGSLADSAAVYYWQTDEHKRDYKELFAELEEQGHTREELEHIFSDPRVKIIKLQLPKSARSKKDKELEEVKEAEEAEKPEEPKKEKEPPSVPKSLVEDMVDFSVTHNRLLRHIKYKHDVDWEIIVAVLKKETNLGRILGTDRVFNAYNTLLRSYKGHPTLKKQREKRWMGYIELIAFLTICKQNNWEPLEVYGSYAGAFGRPQFISTSYLAFAVDGDLDGAIDLFGNWSDVGHSVANYLLKHGWRKRKWDEENKEVLMTYNKSEDYRDEVWEYAQALRKAWKQRQSNP